jgi:hypothetical protein
MRGNPDRERQFWLTLIITEFSALSSPMDVHHQNSRNENKRLNDAKGVELR